MKSYSPLADMHRAVPSPPARGRISYKTSPAAISHLQSHTRRRRGTSHYQRHLFAHQPQFTPDPANRDESIEILTNETEMGPEFAEIIFDIDLPSMTDTPVNRTVFDKTVTTYRDVDFLDDAPMEYQTFVADDAR